MIDRLYDYVGPPAIKEIARRGPHCIHVSQASDLNAWITEQLSSAKKRDTVHATYIIDHQQRLWIADRRSEHVACADGCSVLAAGEMIFQYTPKSIEITEISNQSTGYCPSPECWHVVTRVLTRLKIPYPTDWTASFEFRRCDRCQATNLIKDQVFECDVCGTPLDPNWNYQK